MITASRLMEAFSSITAFMVSTQSAYLLREEVPQELTHLADILYAGCLTLEDGRPADLGPLAQHVRQLRIVRLDGHAAHFLLLDQHGDNSRNPYLNLQ